MPYADDIDEFFNNSVDELPNQSLFSNVFEKSIFYLVDKILNESANGAYFIEVPMTALGPTEISRSFAGFCNSVKIAAGKYVFNRNRNNDNVPISINDLFCKVYRNNLIKIFVKTKKGSRQIFDINTGAAYHYGIENDKPRLLSQNEFEYNNQNGIRKIAGYLDWLARIRIPQEERKVLNNIRNKVLIIGTSELTQDESMVPCCIAREDGGFTNTSPMEPFIFLTVDADRLREMVRRREFAAVICLGDKKFAIGGEWMAANGYFDKIIYVGKKSPLNNVNSIFTYSVSEIHRWYNANVLDPETESACDMELSELFEAYYGIIRELDESGGRFNYPIFKVLDFTFPLEHEDSDFEKIIDRFDEYLSVNLVEANDGIREKLFNAYKNIMLRINKHGNPAKLKYLKELVNKNQNNCFYAVMPHERTLLRNLGITQGNILSSQAYISLIKRLSNTGNNRDRNKFHFFSSVKLYDILQCMDSYSILGRKIIITCSDEDHDALNRNDPRIAASVKRRKNFDTGLLMKDNRSEITGIQYREDEQYEIVDLQDFDDYDTFYAGKTGYVPDTFALKFDDGTYECLAGSVLNEDDKMLWPLTDLAEEKEEVRITYYRNVDEIFERIWRVRYPVLVEEINDCVSLWKKTFRQLASNYQSKRDFYEALCEKGWKTTYNNFSTLLREDDDTQFPIISSLKAIKNLAGEGSEIHNRFDEIKRAVRASALRKDLGRKLAENLYDLYINENFTSELINIIRTADAGLLADAMDKCLIKNKKVISIKKQK